MKGVRTSPSSDKDYIKLETFSRNCNEGEKTISFPQNGVFPFWGKAGMGVCYLRMVKVHT